MRTTIVFAVLAVMIGLASTAEGAEKELFSPSYFPWREQEWGTVVLKAEPIVVNKEAILPRRQGPSAQALAPSASREMSIHIDGVAYESEFDSEATQLLDVAWAGRVSGDKRLSFSGVSKDGVVSGEIWTSQGHRSIVTRDKVTYLVEWNEEELKKLFKDDVHKGGDAYSIIATASRLLIETQAKRRAVAHPSNPDACRGNSVENFDLMLPFTQVALDWFSKDPVVADREIRAAGENGVKAINAITINTTGKLLKRVNLVYMFLVSRVAGQWMSEDLEWAARSPEVSGPRDQYRADVSILLSGVANGGGGLAGALGTAEQGFAVAYIVGGAFGIAHEFGHVAWNMGHHPGNWTNPNPVWAVDHYVDGIGSGVMALATMAECPRGCPMQPYWAYSKAFYEGTQVPTGIPDQRENALAQAYFECTVSLFRLRRGN